MVDKKRAIINGITIGLILVVGLSFFFDGSEQKPQQASVKSSVPIGGAFSLIDDEGAGRTHLDYLGKYSLFYFGYTFCPDVCPLDLQKISLSLTKLDEEGFDISQINPIFITVDPERDTPEIMNEYLESFHPNIIGLSGSLGDVKAAASAYRVYFAKGQVNGDGSYLMDHSSIIYLMDKNGNYLSHFSPSIELAEMATGIKRSIENDR